MKKRYETSTVVWLLIGGIVILICGISELFFLHFRTPHDYREGKTMGIFMILIGLMFTIGSIQMWIQGDRTKED
jgi:predicted transporter